MAAEQKWIESIEKLLVDAKREDARLKAGVKCAGTKLRGHLKEVSELCKEGRKEALETRKAMPKAVPKAKKVTKKPEEVAELVEEPVSDKPKAVTKAPKVEPESKMLGRRPSRSLSFRGSQRSPHSSRNSRKLL